MHPLRKQRLVLVSAIVVVSSIIAVLVGFAMKEYANLFILSQKSPQVRRPRKSIRAGDVWCLALLKIQRIIAHHFRPNRWPSLHNGDLRQHSAGFICRG